MKLLVSYLTRKRSGDVAHRDTEVDDDVIRIGRGTDCQIYLHDPRIAILQAEIHERAGGMYLQDAESRDNMVVNGDVTAHAILKPGDKIELGPFELVVVDAPEGHDLAITVELVHPLGDELEQLRARSGISLSDIAVGPRSLSWILALFVFGLFLAWPVASYFTRSAVVTTGEAPKMVDQRQDRVWPMAADLAWDSGEISGPHKFIGDNCQVCHQTAFEMVTDAACSACHAGVEHHADPARFQFAELAEAQCQSCHKEHGGSAVIIRADQAFCADCHTGLEQAAPDAKLLNVADFGNGHPQFRPAIVVDSKTGKRQRLALDEANWPVERSNLKFPHKAHLKSGGLRVRGQTERRVLACADCHRPERGGVGMMAIEMERDCASCHELRFQANSPRVVPHADPVGVMIMLREFYAEMALRGGVEEADAAEVVRRRPGTELSEAERLAALGWAQARAAQAAEYVFGKPVCGTCHTVSRAEQDGGPVWTIEPIVVVDRWMPKGLFDHDSHAAVVCTDCHAAPTSEVSSDVLLPPIENCQQCHGGEQASARVPSTCITCHLFHQPLLGPMHTPMTAAAVGQG